MNEATLTSQFQTEDRILRYLSAGGYSCRDPSDKRVRRALRVNDPLKSIDERDKKAAWQSSVDTITAYARQSTRANSGKSSKNTISLPAPCALAQTLQRAWSARNLKTPGLAT